MTSGLLEEYGREWLASSMWCCEGKSFSPKAKSTEIEIRERDSDYPSKNIHPGWSCTGAEDYREGSGDGQAPFLYRLSSSAAGQRETQDLAVGQGNT